MIEEGDYVLIKTINMLDTCDNVGVVARGILGGGYSVEVYNRYCNQRLIYFFGEKEIEKITPEENPEYFL